MKLKGYIFSRSFYGERVPQHIQNIVLKDYCTKKKIQFLLSATEYKTEKSAYILSELVQNYINYDGIIFYSLYQLPEQPKLRHYIINQTLKKKKELHFAVENLALKNKKDFLKIERIFLLKEKQFEKENSINKSKLQNFITPNHNKVKRNYIERMMSQKVECMKISKKYGKDYWDGARRYGYGGYKYIRGRWKPIAEKLIKIYGLNNSSSILDVGCGKAFLLYELKLILPKIRILGCDISKHAFKNTKKEIKKNIFLHDLRNNLPFDDKSFDLVISINTLHNLKLFDLKNALKEIERVGNKSYICVESYRNEKEFFNLQCWALTAETLIDTDSWKWLFNLSNFNGDYEFIYFN